MCEKPMQKDVPLENWPWIDIKKIIIIPCGLTIGYPWLGSKFDLEIACVTIEECTLLFRGFKKFKMKSFSLKLADKVALEDIYWRVFGTCNAINYEMPTWILCGFITQSKGHEINWAKAT